MLPLVLVCVVALVVIILVLGWLIWQLMGRVQMMTGEWMQEASRTLEAARTETPLTVTQVLTTMREAAQQQSTDMRELVQVAWAPTFSAQSKALAANPLTLPFAGLETTYGDDKDDDSDPTDVYVPDSEWGRTHQDAVVIGEAAVDPNPFGIEGMISPSVM